MLMLSPWIEDASGHAIRVLEGTDQNDARNHIVQIIGSVPSARIRADNGQHPDWLNWAQGDKSLDNKGWCDRMAKAFNYGLPEEGALVIQYDDGAFNLGPEGSDMNGFTCNLYEASRYTTMAVAQEKLQELLNPDGSGARIVSVRELDINVINALPKVEKKLA